MRKPSTTAVGEAQAKRSNRYIQSIWRQKYPIRHRGTRNGEGLG
ncbi:hypothetical protein [Paenibacillus guangzhouensis]|nr:hypothetical protein [Paenibacillus guangzhouensis]